MSDEYRKLGMDRSITRRDFMNGVAVGITGVSAAFNDLKAFAAQTPGSNSGDTDSDSATYPPLRQGLRGNIPSAVDVFGPMREPITGILGRSPTSFEAHRRGGP